MNHSAQQAGNRYERTFQVFKYTIYFLLFLNIFYWLNEDYQASAHLYPGGISLAQITSAFAQAVDTLAWFILLIALELETSVISDEKLNKGWKWVLNIIAIICYYFIVKAFFGYMDKFFFTLNFVPISLTDACQGLTQYSSVANDLDDYAALTTANCNEFVGQLFANTDKSMLATAEIQNQMIWLGTAEIINAGAWILIVMLLWLDALLLLSGAEHGRLYKINIAAKAVLYLTLIIICLYWGYAGDFMDFWDAFLWILAFFFIELNIFKWNEELEEARA